MNKTELIAAIAEKSGASKKDAEKVVNATFEVITKALAKGDVDAFVSAGNTGALITGATIIVKRTAATTRISNNGHTDIPNGKKINVSSSYSPYSMASSILGLSFDVVSKE